MSSEVHENALMEAVKAWLEDRRGERPYYRLKESMEIAVRAYLDARGPALVDKAAKGVDLLGALKMCVIERSEWLGEDKAAIKRAEEHENGIKAAHQEVKCRLHEDWLSEADVEKAIKAYLDASGLVLVPREPSPADIWQAAMRYRHDAGLIPSSDKETLMRTAHWWHDAWVNSQRNPFESKQDE